VLFDAEDVLRQTDVIRDDDMDAFVAVLLKPAAAVTAGDQAKLYAATDPAVERWNALTPDEREAFRGALKRYLHAYSFLSQIVPVFAEAQEKLYLYGRFLATRIRRDRDPASRCPTTSPSRTCASSTPARRRSASVTTSSPASRCRVAEPAPKARRRSVSCRRSCRR
jgi:hypothetical protein